MWCLPSPPPRVQYALLHPSSLVCWQLPCCFLGFPFCPISRSLTRIWFGKFLFSLPLPFYFGCIALQAYVKIFPFPYKNDIIPAFSLEIYTWQPTFSLEMYTLPLILLAPSISAAVQRLSWVLLLFWGSGWCFGREQRSNAVGIFSD